MRKSTFTCAADATGDVGNTRPRGYADGAANTKISINRAKASKYTDQTGETTYVYVTIVTGKGSATSAINDDSDDVMMGVPQ